MSLIENIFCPRNTITGAATTKSSYLYYGIFRFLRLSYSSGVRKLKTLPNSLSGRTMVSGREHIELVRKATFDVRKTSVFCGLHTVRVTVPVDPNEIKWPNQNKVIEIIRTPGSFKFRAVIFNSRCVTTGQHRLVYNRSNCVLIEFEPVGEFADEATDLLPFSQWMRVWHDTKLEIAEELECPKLSENRPTLLNRFDVGFDVVYDDFQCLQYEDCVSTKY
jgi:hypothetical protein